jgi:hypothetical protein
LQYLAFMKLFEERLPLGGPVGYPLGHLADFFVWGQLQFLAVGVAGRGGFGRPQRLDLLVGVAAAP